MSEAPVAADAAASPAVRTAPSSSAGRRPLRVLRIAHHAVVSEWRQRERELRALGVDVTLISSLRWNEGGVDLDLDPESDDFVTGARTFGRHPSVFLYDPRPIWRALGEKPELIDLHEEPNALATAEVLLLRLLRRSRAPYVMYSAQNLRKRYPVPFRWFEHHALIGGRGAYVCNTEAGEILADKGLGGRPHYVPLGIEPSAFVPAERPLPGAVKVIGYVGRLEPYKGVEVLLRVVARHPDWRLRIVGGGPHRPVLEALAHDLGVTDRVEFLGFAAGDELVRLYQGFDVVGVPSLPWPGWREQFCRVAVEAMACGAPVVGSGSGSIPDVLGGAGRVAEPGDVDAWDHELAAALEPAEWSSLRAQGLARAAEFSWASVARSHLALYEAVAPPTIGPRPLPQVLIVAYGDPAQLDGCLTVLGTDLAVTVVDNSSLPETRTVAEAHGARYLDARRNLGFAGGVNLGLADIASREADQADVLLLNPDARIDAAGVLAMQERFGASDVAVVGAAQREPEGGGPVRVWWPFPTPWGAWAEALGLGALQPGKGFAIGSILLLRAEALGQLGGLDERFFLYSEETDWQLRARRTGWRIELAEVEATHEGGGTGGDPLVRERHFFSSLERYERKHYGALGWQAFRAANVAGAVARAVLPGERGRAARRRARLFARGPIRAAEG